MLLVEFCLYSHRNLIAQIPCSPVLFIQGITGHARSSGLSTRKGLSSTQMQLIDAPGDYVGSSQRTYSTTPNGNGRCFIFINLILQFQPVATYHHAFLH